MKTSAFIIFMLFAKNFAFAQDTTRYCEGFWSTKGRVYLYDKFIKDATPATFQCIEHEYSKDENHIYCSGEIIKGAEVSTFEVLESGYSKDKNFVYYDYCTAKKIKGADPVSFKVFDLSIIKDKNYVYHFKNLKKVVRLKNADAATFHRLCSFYVDKNHLYNSTGNILLDISTMNEEQIRAFCACENSKDNK